MHGALTVNESAKAKRSFRTLFVVLAITSVSQAQLPIFMAARNAENREHQTSTDPAAEVLPTPDQTVYETGPHAAPMNLNVTNFGDAALGKFPLGGRSLNAHCGPSLSATNRAGVCPRCGVDEAGKCCCENGRWRQAMPVDFSPYAQGEYVGPHRSQHVDRYRLRVDDEINLVYRLTRELNANEYRFNIGDELRVEGENLTGESGGDNRGNLTELDRTVVILPDGSITIPYIGQVRAAGRTVTHIQTDIEQRSKQWYKFPIWTVSPIKVNTRLEDLRAAVDARAGNGGQAIALRVSPDGTIQPPAIGSVCVQGLTLDEAKFEIDQRYRQANFRGIEVSAILTARAPTFVYVVGEVAQPGRFTLERPTTVMGAIALAGGWNIGGNLRQIIVFRRADDWRLVATRINLQGALMGRHPTPADEIFLRDSDVVLVPKSPIQRIDDAINLVFTQGVNELIPFGSAAGFLDLSFVQ